ncbi:glycosyltransferase family 4 protein [Halomonas sp. BC04]|uniref:glycosyltransferase family 4 protein n=1 Tax=Halomonas sp. BC04 TaxID=1403540 RepID=UPI0004B20965|nr:glycosyltransferase family 4 protein [Halomonas sp. BC04]
MKRIAFVVAAPATAEIFLRGHIAALGERYQVDLIANLHQHYPLSVSANKIIHAPIHRSINVWLDFMALLALIRIFSKNRYDAVHSVTPKAGLLTMIAAWVTRVPVRNHTFTGQVWVTRAGLPRNLLRSLDKLVYSISTHSLVDSHSQRDFLLTEKVIQRKKSSVLANGSISGVNVDRFKPDSGMRKIIRDKYGVSDNDLVFLFLGRINPDKGVPELISAFRRVSKVYTEAKLLIVGEDESGMFDDGSIEDSFMGKLIRVGCTSEPEAYFNAADVFCLPSHREGFGSVLIEAAACGVASIASNIYGISDALVDNRTGLLHSVKCEEDLIAKMIVLVSNPRLRKQLANAAMLRARGEFSSSVLEQELVAFYEKVFLDGEFTSFYR